MATLEELQTEINTLKGRLNELSRSQGQQNLDFYGVQYKLGEILENYELYENAISTLYSNLDTITHSNQIYEGLKLMKDTLQTLFDLNSVTIYSRTLGGRYDNSLPLSSYFNLEIPNGKYAQGKSLLELAYSLNIYTPTKCNPDWLVYITEDNRNYAYTSIATYAGEPIFGVIFTSRLQLSPQVLNIMENILRVYGAVIYMKRETLTSSLIMKQLCERLNRAEEVSLTDPKTHLYNQAGLNKYLETQYKGSPYTIVFFDIDNFKHLNDTYGHNAGDCALVWFAKNIKEFSIQLGGDAYRIGGDEFVALFKGESDLSDLVENSLENFMNDVRRKQFTFTRIRDKQKALTEETDTEATDSDITELYSFTTSIGVYYNDKCIPYEEAKALADKALYASKDRGKDSVTRVH